MCLWAGMRGKFRWNVINDLSGTLHDVFGQRRLEQCLQWMYQDPRERLRVTF
jgi:hypothetical protein